MGENPENLKGTYARIIRQEPTTNHSISSMFLSISKALHDETCDGIELVMSESKTLRFSFETAGNLQSRTLSMRFGKYEYKCMQQPKNTHIAMGHRAHCGVGISWFTRKTWKGTTLEAHDWLGRVEDGLFYWHYGAEEMLEKERYMKKLLDTKPTPLDYVPPEVQPRMETGFDVLVDTLHRRIAGVPLAA